MFEFMGGTILASRKMKGLTQEQLAELIGVSSVAVSKWERGISTPELEILCQLSDLFGISVDELLGRSVNLIEENEIYSDELMKRFDLAKKLYEYSNIADLNGVWHAFYVIECEKYDSFLTFCVSFITDTKKKGLEEADAFSLLNNYAETEKDTRRSRMICDGLAAIMKGKSEAMVKEILASHLGKECRNKFIHMADKEQSRKSILDSYINKECSVDLIEELADCDDRTIQLILRKIDNTTLVYALSGASGKVCRKFLQNVSSRLLFFLDEDIRQCKSDKEKIQYAQRSVLQIAGMLYR